LLKSQDTVCAECAESPDSVIRNAGPVEAVHDLGQRKMSRCGPLKVVEEERSLHAGPRKFFDFARTDRVVQGTTNLFPGVIHAGDGRFVRLRDDLPRLG
jgi:hypothetical protein